MSARPDSVWRIAPMRTDDLDAVMSIESAVYPFPWTRGNFADSMATGYRCDVASVGGELVAYSVLMLAMDESHLLNLTVSGAWQRRGYGRGMLLHLMDAARAAGARRMFLEVRPSNDAGRSLYAANGFLQIAVRWDYYPAEGGREHALLLARDL
jgi:ribosomal-protein-alanine N-acetyltransferase